MLFTRGIQVSALVLLVVLALAPTATGSPPARVITPPAPTTAPAPAIRVGGANQVLNSMARLLAAAVSEVRVRKTLHAAISKRFDGDENALWSSVAEGSTFNAAVAKAVSRHRATKITAQRIASMTRDYPRLQIAMPEAFDSWNPIDDTPLVAFFPEGVDDTTVDTLTAYDTGGNVVLLDATVPPESSVIVLGMNERTDEAGRLRNEESVDRSAALVKSAAPSAATASYQVRMYLVELKDDKEPWPKGDAEINLESKGEGCGFAYDDYNWASLNDSGDLWQGPRELGYTTCNVVFYWWEDDGGSWDFTLEWGGVNLGAHMDDDDDRIGGGRVLHSQFAGAGTDDWDKLEWTALYQYTD